MKMNNFAGINRFLEEPPWMRSIREMAECFREPEWIRKINEATSRINQISQLQNLWDQSKRMLEFSSQFDRATETMRILEAAQPMLETQNRLKDILGNQQYMQSIDIAARLQKDLFANSELMQAAQEAAAWYNNNAMLFHSFETLMPVISDIPLMKAVAAAQSNFVDMARGFDISLLSFGEGTLIYDGQEYTIDELGTELDNEIAIVEKHKTIPEKFEDAKKKFWLIVLIIYIVSVIPEVAEKVEWYTEKIQAAISILGLQEETSADVFAYVIKDSAVLRESANSKSPQIIRLLYDTKLQVISDIPRWYEVEYIDDEGNSVIGWISKISVTTED
jgi:hypothetical protein